ncbi:hypothetical protein FM037_02090 [Shewanella psychropiezotolerans]|uniref:Uncharacterized protein n=1 Tax=Shewanella psychropiezotolerans TaxID=2593655 RepID=A0ABX5WV42_9GAMM|nr:MULTISPECIES: hypothetical protein [Shewanella]MPY25925.1 hypothetical protein [Shewanella sp. YLB-07]QDO82247.1 hypothetical protein FM037_02090 [Shewanella psychropiezotolerans]
MKKPPLGLSILMFLYFALALIALFRAVNTQAVDLFSLGVIPVLIGLLLRTNWASIVFKVYLGIQTLGLSALGGTAIIAYQISPQDVKVILDGHDIPVPLIAIVATLLLSFQIYLALAKSTKAYLQAEESIEHE